MCVIITVFLFFDLWIKFGLYSLPSSLHSYLPTWFLYSQLQGPPAPPSCALPCQASWSTPTATTDLFDITTSELLLLVVVLVSQLCPTLYNTMNCSLPGSSIHGIPQVRILEWAVIPLSRGFSWPKDQTQVSHIAGRFFTVWTTRETDLKLFPVFKCVFLLLCIFPPIGGVVLHHGFH